MSFAAYRVIALFMAAVALFQSLAEMASICRDFKWLGFRFSDLIQNPDHLQPNLFLTIQNPD